MKLNFEGLKDTAAWQAAGIALPDYDPEKLAEASVQDPRWVHFGIGNIFRIFIGGIADTLIRAGKLDRGIACVETFDYDVVDRVYVPHDNLAVSVTLYPDGRTDKRVLGCLSEAVKVQAGDEAAWARLRKIFTNPGLQMVSFTITEKGYQLRGTDGAYLGYVKADLEGGPAKVTGAMGIVTALLYARWQAGAKPLTLVSMDNVARNGEKLRNSVLETARVWAQNGLADAAFVDYVSDEDKVSFPWTMIDKITPRPSEDVAKMLEGLGVEDIQPIVTSRRTYIAPFINAEKPQYLVVEDHFPNGRPPLEDAGVYMTTRETVNLTERMKVTACLNPIHTAVGPYGVLLGYELFADCMSDPELSRLGRQLGYREGLPVVEDPGILSPKAFIDECFEERFPNVYLGDTNQRLCVDISQGVAFRFGETIKAYVSREGSAGRLTAVPLAIAGWLRYILQADDQGGAYQLAPDPLVPGIREALAGVEIGRPDSLTDQLRPILSNAHIWGLDLYPAGVGEKVEAMFREEIAGPGAVRAALKKHLDQL